LALKTLLSIETSTFRGSVALGDADRVLGWRALSAERRHTTELMPVIADLLAEAGRSPADVEVLCFSQGPGSFTGLRVAATVAQMWQSAAGCRVVAVSTLEVIARNGLDHPDTPRRLAVVLDARGGRVFGAVYERRGKDELGLVSEPGMHDPAAWLATIPRPCSALGDGVARRGAEITAAGLEALREEYWWPDARQVLQIGRRLAAAGDFCTPQQIRPAYLRPPECEEVYEKRRAEARARRGQYQYRIQNREYRKDRAAGPCSLFSAGTETGRYTTAGTGTEGEA